VVHVSKSIRISFEYNTNLSRWGLGEPESPSVGERVLDIEVVGIMKDGDYVASVGVGATISLTARGSDWDCVERHR